MLAASALPKLAQLITQTNPDREVIFVVGRLNAGVDPDLKAYLPVLMAPITALPERTRKGRAHTVKG
jgi:hypothetical protein